MMIRVKWFLFLQPNSKIPGDLLCLNFLFERTPDENQNFWVFSIKVEKMSSTFYGSEDSP